MDFLKILFGGAAKGQAFIIALESKMTGSRQLVSHIYVNYQSQLGQFYFFQLGKKNEKC